MLGNHACCFGSRLVFAFSCSFDEYCLIYVGWISVDTVLSDRLPVLSFIPITANLHCFSPTLQDDTYTESYISTIGVDFVSCLISLSFSLLSPLLCGRPKLRTGYAVRI